MEDSVAAVLSSHFSLSEAVWLRFLPKLQLAAGFDLANPEEMGNRENAAGQQLPSKLAALLLNTQKSFLFYFP